MGLMFLYLTPAFYVDVTESWIAASRLQRMATILAGIWIEMIVCGVATIVWTSTLPGQWIHDFLQAHSSHRTGGGGHQFQSAIKLDVHHFFAECGRSRSQRALHRISSARYSATFSVSRWTFLRWARRRVALFALYALISGTYSYLLLLLFVRFK